MGTIENAIEELSDDEEEEVVIEKKINRVKYTPPEENIIDFINYNAFIEKYNNNLKNREFKIFCDLELKSFTEDGDVSEKLLKFRRKIYNDIFIGLKHSLLSDEEKNKWGNRTETIIYDMMIREPITEYFKKAGEIVNLFNKDRSFGMNDVLFKNIYNKSIEPVNMRKYDTDCLSKAFFINKNISLQTQCSITNYIKLRNNKQSVIYIIEFFNLFKNSEIIKPKMYPSIVEPSADIKRKFTKELKNTTTKQNIKPLIISHDGKTHVFDTTDVRKHFGDNPRSKKYNGISFEQDMISKIMETDKNKCSYCSDDIKGQNLRSVFQDKKSKKNKIIYFCSIQCFMDIEWKSRNLKG